MTVMMTEMNDTGHKDVAALLHEALRDAGLTQYKLAQRLAALRPCSQCEGAGEIVPFARRKAVPCQACNGTGRSRVASQDQQLRRILRFGQLPTEEYSASMARAFDPDLDLPDNYFFTPRETAQQFREQAFEQLAFLQGQIAELQEQVKRLEDDKRLRSA